MRIYETSIEGDQKETETQRVELLRRVADLGANCRDIDIVISYELVTNSSAKIIIFPHLRFLLLKKIRHKTGQTSRAERSKIKQRYFSSCLEANVTSKSNLTNILNITHFFSQNQTLSQDFSDFLGIQEAAKQQIGPQRHTLGCY